MSSYDVPPETFQRALGPVRMYYRLMRRWYGGKRKPFGTDAVDGMHPLIVYYKRYSAAIRMVILLGEDLVPSICLLLLLVTCYTAFHRLYRCIDENYDRDALLRSTGEQA